MQEVFRVLNLQFVLSAAAAADVQQKGEEWQSSRITDGGTKMRINLALQLWHPSQDGKHKDPNIHTDTDRHALGPAKTLGVFLFFCGSP